jgi:hypothetical protein
MGRHGLFELSHSDELPPPLSPVVQDLESRETRQVEVAPEPHNMHGEVVELQQILLEPRPEKPKPLTHKGKSEWKKKEETFKEKLIRKFTPKKSKASMSYQAEDIPPVMRHKADD